MRFPSIQTISKIPKVTPEQAKLARLALTASMEQVVSTFPHTRQQDRACYFRWNSNAIRMHACDEALGTFGLESIIGKGRTLYYCNVGDAYIPTLCFEYRMGGLRRIFVGSYGDWVEKYGGKEE